MSEKDAEDLKDRGDVTGVSRRLFVGARRWASVVKSTSNSHATSV